MTATQHDFTGHSGRECGEHRSTGPRAWCHDCTEWCYPEAPCRGCEIPQLRVELDTARARVVEVEAENERLRDVAEAESAHECPSCAQLDALTEPGEPPAMSWPAALKWSGAAPRLG